MELTKWNKAKQAIIEAKSVDEVKDIRDKAEAMRVYAKQVGESLEVQNDICEIKLRAERRMGEMLKEMPRATGKFIPGSKGLQDVTPNTTTLKDIGIEKHMSSRYQMIAELPTEKFEEIINETKVAEKELTEALMIRTAKQIDRQIKIQEQRESIENGTIKLPEGVFETIVIDPPWMYGEVDNYDPLSPFGRVTSPYPEMSQDRLLEIELPAAENCILWLWTTNKFMPDAYELLEKWGFDAKTILTWDKINIGIGRWLRNVTEHCILAVKGKPLWDNTRYSTILHEKKTSHSVKPQGFYDMVDKLCVGRKLDYFARKKRDGWEVFGDEIVQN